VRFTFRNSGDQQRLVYLRQDYPLFDSLTLYEPVDGGWKAHATGDRLPFGSRDVSHSDFLFPLTVPPGTQRTIYLRFASQGPVDIFFPTQQTREKLSREQLAYGVAGCVLMLLVWGNLVRRGARKAFRLLRLRRILRYMMVNTGLAFSTSQPAIRAGATPVSSCC
jgi:hypothetical protein